MSSALIDWKLFTSGALGNEPEKEFKESMLRKAMKHHRDNVIRILETNRGALRELSVCRLGLFGSCARGGSARARDLDFVVKFDFKSFDRYMDLKFYLEELFDCRVDIGLLSAIKPRLRDNILAETIFVSGF